MIAGESRIPRGHAMPITPEQQAEIEAARAQSHTTMRATAPGMEQHLYKAHEVLDHGFVRVIDYMGDDAAICQAPAFLTAKVPKPSPMTRA